MQNFLVRLHADYHDIWNNPRSSRRPRSACESPKRRDKRPHIHPEDNQAAAGDKPTDDSYTLADRNSTSAKTRKWSLVCSRCRRTGSSSSRARSDRYTSVCSALPCCRRFAHHRPHRDADSPSLTRLLRLNNLRFTLFFPPIVDRNFRSISNCTYRSRPLRYVYSCHSEPRFHNISETPYGSRTVITARMSLRRCVVSVSLDTSNESFRIF